MSDASSTRKADVAEEDGDAREDRATADAGEPGGAETEDRRCGGKGRPKDDHAEPDGADAEGGGDEGKPKKPMSPRKKRLLIIGGALVAVAALVGLTLWWLEARKWQTTANAYIRAPIARLSPGVAGHVGQLFVQDNQIVRAGQPILRLSGATFAVSVARAEAELASARAQLLQARAAARAARAVVTETSATADARDAEADRARREFTRYASLSAAALAEQERDRAEGEALSAAATATAAKRAIGTQRARVDQADADVAVALARVRQAEAALNSARISQGDTLLVAPIDGRVTQFEVEPGDYVTPGQSVLAVVGNARWIEANFKESQLRLMRPGQHVDVTIDAWSDYKLAAVVQSVQAGTGSEFSALPRQNATANWVETVQRVPVKLVFARDAFRNYPARADIVPGLSVEASVRVRP